MLRVQAGGGFSFFHACSPPGMEKETGGQQRIILTYVSRR